MTSIKLNVRRINKVKCTSHYFITLAVMISLDMIITIYHNS